MLVVIKGANAKINKRDSLYFTNNNYDTMFTTFHEFQHLMEFGQQI
jgi:hypothetical protein